MKTAYFDCIRGAAGDMICGALVAAGADRDQLQKHLVGLSVDGYRLEMLNVKKQGIAATQFIVTLQDQHQHPHRHLRHIRDILNQSELPDSVCTTSLRIFERLAEAEARVHGSTPEKVHFHEVGAVDAIVDIVGAVTALHLLGIEQVLCSPIPVGSGTVTCDHGVMPVPAPATAELLLGIPIAETAETGELTTPTGAAILTTLATRFCPPPTMVMHAIGYGAGTRDGQHVPNVLRVLIGESDAITTTDQATSGAATPSTDTVVLLEANLDDATGQMAAHCMEQLLRKGALDAWCVPITMKKSRPGLQLTAIANPHQLREMESIIFAETTTFGIRHQIMRRSIMERRWETVETKYGAIRMKVGESHGIVTATPEYDDCQAAAHRCEVPLPQVLAAAQFAWASRAGTPAT